MIIPASSFNDLPAECPVLWGDTNAVIVARHGATEYRIRVEGRLPNTTATHESMLRVNLSTSAVVRAFVPALITEVKGVPVHARPFHPPTPLFGSGGKYVLFHAFVGDKACRYRAGEEESIEGTTPEECLINGLEAVLRKATKES